jgi:hypothetical protein
MGNLVFIRNLINLKFYRMRKVYVAFILVFLAGFRVSAQELPVHKKKIYMSPEGKVFINKSLPVYFFISTSNDPNAPHFLLKSETMPKYSNPMYFDTEGRNTLRSPSAVDTVTKKVIMPKTDIQYHVYVDSKPPSTKIAYNKSKETIMKGIHYVTDSLALSFEAVDALSGVEDTYISIDGSAYKPFHDAITLNQEKQYLIKYYSVDNTGNVEHLKEIKFSVDKTPPISSLNITGPQYETVLSGKSQLSIASKDDISGVKHIFISIDDSVFRPYAAKINASALTQGEHKLFYYATDQVNNKEKVVTYAFYVDKTPPKVIEEIQGKTFMANGKEFSAGTSKLKITSFDNKAGVKDIFYSINNAPFGKYDKPVVLSGYKGDLLIKSYAVDNVGNQSISETSDGKKNSIPYIDLGAPWVGHAFRGPYFENRDTTFISSKTSIVLEAKDAESGIQRIEYQIDSIDLAKYEDPLNIKREGYHHISIYGYDNTENLTRQEFGVMVDTTGPEISEHFSSLSLGIIESEGIKLNQYPDHAVVFLSATDVKSGFKSLFFDLNNTVMQPYTNSIRNFISGRKNTIKVRAIDNLGNQSEKIIEFFIK